MNVGCNKKAPFMSVYVSNVGITLTPEMTL